MNNIKGNIKNYKNTSQSEIINRKKNDISKRINKNKLNKKHKHKKSRKKIIETIQFNKNKIFLNNITTNIISKADKGGKKENSKKKSNKQDKVKGINNFIKYTDEEINELPFYLAIHYDKWNYCQYYISLIRTKHNLIFALHGNDYNSRMVKIDL